MPGTVLGPTVAVTQYMLAVVVLQSLSHVWLCSMSGPSVLDYLLEFAQMHVHWVYLILCCPFFLLPSVFPRFRVFSNDSTLCIRWPNDWSFSFSISPSNEYSRLISFRIDWFDLLAVQGTLKSLLQHHNLKASIFQCSAFFMVQLSQPYMTTGKTTALTIWTILSVFVLVYLCSHTLTHKPKFPDVEKLTLQRGGNENHTRMLRSQVSQTDKHF